MTIYHNSALATRAIGEGETVPGLSDNNTRSAKAQAQSVQYEHWHH